MSLPAGAGSKNGTSWANAYDQALLQTAITATVASDTLYIGSGDFTGNRFRVFPMTAARLFAEPVGSEGYRGFPRLENLTPGRRPHFLPPEPQVSPESL